MRLVDEQVVDAGRLEGDARVLGRSSLALIRSSARSSAASSFLTVKPSALLAACDPLAQLVELAVEVLPALAGADGMRSNAAGS